MMEDVYEKFKTITNKDIKFFFESFINFLTGAK
jgi:hypothetical protein